MLLLKHTSRLPADLLVSTRPLSSDGTSAGSLSSARRLVSLLLAAAPVTAESPIVEAAVVAGSSPCISKSTASPGVQLTSLETEKTRPYEFKNSTCSGSGNMGGHPCTGPVRCEACFSPASTLNLHDVDYSNSCLPEVLVATQFRGILSLAQARNHA